MTGVHVAAPEHLLMLCAVILPQVFLYEARIITASPCLSARHSAQTWRTFQFVFREEDARYGHMGALLFNSGSYLCSMVGLHLEARPLSRNLAWFTGLSLFFFRQHPHCNDCNTQRLLSTSIPINLL